MEERWGLFLKHLNLTDRKKAEVDFNNFLSALEEQYDSPE